MLRAHESDRYRKATQLTKTGRYTDIHASDTLAHRWAAWDRRSEGMCPHPIAFAQNSFLPEQSREKITTIRRKKNQLEERSILFQKALASSSLES